MYLTICLVMISVFPSCFSIPCSPGYTRFVNVITDMNADERKVIIIMSLHDIKILYNQYIIQCHVIWVAITLSIVLARTTITCTIYWLCQLLVLFTLDDLMKPSPQIELIVIGLDNRICICPYHSCLPCVCTLACILVSSAVTGKLFHY